MLVFQGFIRVLFSFQFEDCIDTLNGMLEADGPHLLLFTDTLRDEPRNEFKGNAIVSTYRGVDQVAAFQGTKTRIISSLVANLRRRFPRMDLLEAMQVFDTKALPEDAAQLQGWGNGHLNVLLSHFGEGKRNTDGTFFHPVVDRDQCRNEFAVFKRVMFRNKSTITDDGVIRLLRPMELFQKIFGQDNAHNKGDFASVYRLMSLCLVVMVGNAEAERAFSVQNRVKSTLRANLKIQQLDRLIRIRYANIDLEVFPFARAAEHWLGGRFRRL